MNTKEPFILPPVAESKTTVVMSAITRRNATLVVVCLVFGILWFSMLGYRDLFDPDEGRYAEIPAAMITSGDWTTPRLNGLKYLEKPAFQYWGTAASYLLFGESNATARLFPAIMGFLMALFAALVSLRLFGWKAGIHTGLIIISGMMVVIFGHVLTLDMTLSTLVMMGIGSLVMAQSYSPPSDGTRNWMLVAWAALALATLTKGPVAVFLPFISVVIYSVWQRDITLWKNLHFFKGILLYLLIISPWFVAVSLANPEFFQFFFIHENLERYTTTIHNREGPIYYFIPFLLLGLCPWLICSLKSMARPGFSWMPGNPGQFDAQRFIWTFAVVTFIFFSLGQSKLPGYILPVFPAIAILTGRQLSCKQGKSGDFWLMCALGVLIFGAAFAVQYLASARFPLEQWQSYQPWIMASGILFVSAGLLGLGLRTKRMTAHILAALLCLASIQSLILGFGALAETRSGRVIAEVITRSIPRGTPVFSYRSYSESSIFYLGFPVTLVAYSGELTPGIKAEPDKAIETLEEFLGAWGKLKQAALVIDNQDFERFNLQEMSAKVVYRGPKQMVLVKL